LMWNRVMPTEASRQGMNEIYADYGATSPASNSSSNATTALTTILNVSDFAVERLDFSEDLQYSTQDWLGLVFTHSNHLVLEPAAKAELRDRLREFIGEGGVSASNNALALLCSLSSTSRG
jgi:hypothetical protein